jgi:hypothetical protein
MGREGGVCRGGGGVCDRVSTLTADSAESELTARRARRTIGPLAQNRNQLGHPSIFGAVTSTSLTEGCAAAGGNSRSREIDDRRPRWHSGNLN